MDNSQTSSGIGFSGLLTIVFITLKLIGTIHWSWWWVLSPVWIPAALVLGVFVLLFLTAYIFEILKRIF